MSEIRVTTLKDTSGGNSSSTADIYSGRAKAWVNWNGVSTVAIRASFNVNSITDVGTGHFTVNFTTSFSDTNYCFAGGGQRQNNVVLGANHICSANPEVPMATGSLRVSTTNDQGDLLDSLVNTLQFFR